MMKRSLLLSLSLALTLSSFQCSFAKMSVQSNRLYTSALAHEQEGNYKEALNYVKKALQYSPDDAVLNIKLAGLYQSLGNIDDAIGAYNRAITLRPADGFLYISLANVLMQKYDYNNALLSYEKAQTLLPEYKYNYINIANVKYLLSDYSGAIDAYNKFLEAYPDNLEGQSAIANIYLEKKEYDKAIENFALALRTNPKEFRDYSNYGLALLRSNDLEKAEIAFKSAVGVNKNDSMSWANLGIVQMKKDNLADAEYSFRHALELDNDLDAIRCDYASLLAMRKQNDKAIEQYKLFISKYPESMNGYFGLADIYSKQGDFARASKVLEMAKQVKPDDMRLKFELAKSHQNAAQFENALKDYNDILLIDKTNAVALYNKAVVLTELGKYQDAANIYNQLLKYDVETLKLNNIYTADIQNDMIDNQVKYAKSLYDAGDYKKAKAIYTKLLETKKDDYRIYSGLGDCCLSLGMNMYAKNYFEEAIQLDNTDSNALVHYAQSLYQLKDYDTAVAVLEKAHEISPDDAEILYNIALIQYQTVKYDDALKTIDNSILIKNNSADSYHLKALILEALKNYKDAIFAYEKYVELCKDEEQKARVEDKIKSLYDFITK